ncbi:LacI family DNA-binding transcriptional regulator [Chimaeribacter arupi]|mgnify:CR=1 FL=1|uniref:LacI family transcriptional regulator n=1 Tax=Chimaeribacter arupi TaxID=2060066 RepID=A0A2N5EPB3_9GAMM|nr:MULTISPECIES: LacI family DNA-binding transcriptional regulator [Yersiniaceae]MDV5140684.1 LacI family DNA-binding transcriptional regulator [Chimaeribacter arupi]PLR33870.1 LacI family transcriptional regulator [Chimaeribacter arupi]PLR51134.1 LacI family transcriptional regulator [Chimaeribacter arupi]PLR54454.1 LacI family transcriptional regulator [Chimaeribacter arupi]WKZ92575.1 LacI family DNA-binding transcriptional regulator [Chimaeribacter arupi]
MAATIYDIARMAGVSKSTVSRVLNNQPNISPEARDRVLQAIDTLNYQPSKLARALTSSGFDAIMVISTRPTRSTLGNPFFADIVHAIASRAEEEGFDVILQTSRNSEDDLQKCLVKIKEKMVKGIIMLSSPADEAFFAQLDSYTIPVVVIGRVEGQYRHIFSVDTDNVHDSYRMTQALIAQGHRAIACLHASLDFHVSIDRLAGYRQAMADAGLPVDPAWIVDGGNSVEEGYEAACRLLALPSLPTAVLATDALKILSLYRAAQEQGCSIPDRLSVMGFSNTGISPLLTPPLSGIDVPTAQLGWQGGDLLFARIAGREPSQMHTLVETEIRYARSTAAPAPRHKA